MCNTLEVFASTANNWDICILGTTPASSDSFSILASFSYHYRLLVASCWRKRPLSCIDGAWDENMAQISVIRFDSSHDTNNPPFCSSFFRGVFTKGWRWRSRLQRDICDDSVNFRHQHCVAMQPFLKNKSLMVSLLAFGSNVGEHLYCVAQTCRITPL